ncbi:hypothetical protein MC885_015340, partial [Smutsia gigantea]
AESAQPTIPAGAGAGAPGGDLRSGQTEDAERSRNREVLRSRTAWGWEREIETQLLKPLPRSPESHLQPSASRPASLPQRRPSRRVPSYVHPQRGGGLRAPRRPRRPPCPGPPTDTYTLIAPNENRRNRIQRIAEKELENLEKWKEQHRAKPVSLVPRQLGGSQSEAEVRQKQQLQLMQAKYRQKSNKLEEKKRLQENLRREAFREHQQ